MLQQNLLMSIALEFFNVIVPKRVLQDRYPGGADQYKQDAPPFSYAEDEALTRVAFMNSTEVSEYIDTLLAKGLVYDEDLERADDFSVLTNMWGPSWEVAWLEYDTAKCWFREDSQAG
jgi:hypothetical protein